MGSKKKAQTTFDPTSPEGRATIAAVVAWGLAWKAASLWVAAKNNSKPWFATLFITNTLGVLDAVYIFGVSRRRTAAASRALRQRAAHGELDL